ncbi:benzoate 4-monooxygenase cytochrome p450 [Grosmannia clavigera kw1407]|uniref:Benzoate 4-monooxygenase cytochrome p450 n=1 Tax=Grosmannia clavigera (strain kw1407 / UAMH 11150) TaxID=655863 RepID=F0XI88_GROCL|nr:benzoate 4-monooxygenase cytochrome p450 [Grosmannia clavigera kw1407]EFX03043.1 benzoate 4-monooxygenase cytochrome p450 [Grosmannia clavigera kw1407]
MLIPLNDASYELALKICKQSLISVAGIVGFYQTARIIYNLFIHPLRHIPGPWLSAASYLPEFYYDVFRSGRYTRQIQNMHEKYGPIVRINPDEVHCSDHRFIDEIYAGGGRKRDKPTHQVRGSGVAENATFSTINHDLHRMRRGALSKFFSRAQVSRLEPTVRNLAEGICDKMLRVKQQGPFDVTTALSLFTTDVITGYCLGENLGLIAQKGWEPNFREPLFAQLKLVYWFRFIPWLKHAGFAMAMFTRKLSEDMETLFSVLIVDMPGYVKKAQTRVDKGIDDGTTVFGSVLQSDLPQAEKTTQRLVEEGFSLFVAGTETVSWTLTVIAYHLLTKPAILSKITAEVREATGNSGKVPQWAALEKLPYLSSVIYEGLRLSYGLASRTSRVATSEDLVYRGDWTPKKSNSTKKVDLVIPRGYAIGMSAVITHHDESIFPDSHSFIPERWLDENQQHRKELDRSLLSFSKGSRGCIGIKYVDISCLLLEECFVDHFSLAYCELYVLLGLLVDRVFPHMKLYKTTEADIAWDHDFFNPFPVWGSQGVRAVIV